MKKAFHISLIILLFSGCQKENPEPDLALEKLIFFGSTDALLLPDNILNSSNEHAQRIRGEFWFKSKLIHLRDSIFVVPENALEVKIIQGNFSLPDSMITRIKTFQIENVSGVSEETYQVSSSAKRQYFEYFSTLFYGPFKVDWYPSDYAYQNIDRSSGVYISTLFGDPEYWIQWHRSGQEIKIQAYDSKADNFEFIFDTLSGSGIYSTYSDIYFIALVYQVKWDTEGNGTWTYYKNGIETSSGSL